MFSDLWPLASQSAGLALPGPASSLARSTPCSLSAATHSHPMMGYLDDIDFQETAEEEGRSVQAMHDTERDSELHSVPATTQFNISRLPSPSVYAANSPGNISIQQPSTGPYSGLSSAASSRSFPSSVSATFNGLYEWNTLQRKVLAAHAEDVCRDMDVPADEQKAFIENAQVCRLMPLKNTADHHFYSSYLHICFLSLCWDITLVQKKRRTMPPAKISSSPAISK